MVANKKQKMSKKKQSYNKKLLVAGLVVAVLLVLAILEKTNVTHFITLHPAAPTTVSGKGPTPEQKNQQAQTDADAKKQFIENGGSDGQTQSTSPASADKVQISAKQESNGTVTILTKLYGVGDGTCNLTVKNGGQTTTQSADIIYQTQFSSCAGFSVPISGLGTGNWQISLSETSGGSSSTANTTLEVN